MSLPSRIFVCGLNAVSRLKGIETNRDTPMQVMFLNAASLNAVSRLKGIETECYAQKVTVHSECYQV